MAMSLALIGLRVPGVFVADPACVGKTFPDYWDRLSAITQDLSAITEDLSAITGRPGQA
jgi:3-phosphoshikimate 1-carboxyvinyltransferase